MQGLTARESALLSSCLHSSLGVLAGNSKVSGGLSASEC